MTTTKNGGYRHVTGITSLGFEGVAEILGGKRESDNPFPSWSWFWDHTHFSRSAKGVIYCRLSVRPSVCLSKTNCS